VERNKEPTKETKMFSPTFPFFLILVLVSKQEIKETEKLFKDNSEGRIIILQFEAEVDGLIDVHKMRLGMYDAVEETLLEKHKGEKKGTFNLYFSYFLLF